MPRAAAIRAALRAGFWLGLYLGLVLAPLVLAFSAPRPGIENDRRPATPRRASMR